MGTRLRRSRHGVGVHGRDDEGTRQAITYTKLSFTETTKTFPASLSLAELMYPGMWFSEHAGEKAAGTPVRNR
jgi:hypothetical protein